jgi:hypothetical protein
MEDVKVILIDLLSRNINLTKDDGKTPATITVTTKWYDDKTMDASDGIVTVGTIDDTVDPSGLGHLSEDHLHVAEINVWTASKFDGSGNQVVTDEIMRWKLCQKVSQIIRANQVYPLYGSPSQPSGLEYMRVRIFRDLDDPSKTPYPLRRTQFEVLCWFDISDLSGGPYEISADDGAVGADVITVV